MDGNLGNFQEATDHISGLPDAILGYILSFVPTKSSVKTSILSKRWQHVWTKVPALDFTEMPSSNGREIFYINLSREHEICFRSFVDRVLLYHDTVYLQHLRLRFGDDDFKFKSWLDAILLKFIIRKIDMEVRCNIQQGQLHGQRVLLPPSILSAKKLVILQLTGLFEFDLPISINLPNLEEIHLSLVKLPGDEFMRKLSVNCPALKKLFMYECYGVQTLHVESLTLETLQVISKTVSIVIKAPSLKSLFLAGTLTQYAIGDLPLLMEAHLYLCFAKSSDALLLLRRVSGAKTLQLRMSPCLIFGRDYPVFQNLTRFAITAEVGTLQILNFAPQLKSLIIEKVLCHATSFEDTSMAAHYPAGLSFDRSFMPKLLPCLEHVEFLDFGGRPNEMELVAYFLEVGSALKTMEITTRRLVCGEDVCQDILMLPRSSATCQVKIVNAL